MDLTVEGNLDVGALAAFVPEMTASGDLRAAVHVSGPRAQPRLEGSFEDRQGAVCVSSISRWSPTRSTSRDASTRPA